MRSAVRLVLIKRERKVMNEAHIVINGTELTRAQSKTIRIARRC
jgi:hypothetical protein